MSFRYAIRIALGLVPALLPIHVRATTLSHVGTQTVETGTSDEGFEFGGISGISYDPYSELFTAITDDSRANGASRMWKLDLTYDGTSFSSSTILSSVALKKPDGSPLPRADTEGIAGNLDGSFYISQEGLASGTDPAYSIPPWIYRFHPTTGNKEGEVALPMKFLPRNSSGGQVPPDDPAQTSGVRSNLSLESLGLTPSRKSLFTATEAALKQDYSGSYDSTLNQAQNSESRILRFSGVPGSPAAVEEKVYRADQGTLFIFVRRFNTVPDMLPVDDNGKLLVLERGLSANNTNTGSYRIRIYEVNFNQTGATNVAGVDSLVGASYTRLNKTLLWESSSNMDNVEAICFGRDINGFRTLVLASDNNFNASQVTQFHVFTTDIPAVTRRTLTTAVTGSGTVVAAPAVAWCPDGSEVVLTATPETNYVFEGWTGSLSGSTNPQALTMDADKSGTANFLSPYQSWSTIYFTHQEINSTGLSSPLSDPEQDGVGNLIEYAFNMHPRVASRAGLPVIQNSGGELIFIYKKDTSKPDINYKVQVSEDLSISSWSDLEDSLVSTNGAIETRRAAVSVEDTPKFMRLVVTQLF